MKWTEGPFLCSLIFCVPNPTIIKVTVCEDEFMFVTPLHTIYGMVLDEHLA